MGFKCCQAKSLWMCSCQGLGWPRGTDLCRESELNLYFSSGREIAGSCFTPPEDLAQGHRVLISGLLEFGQRGPNPGEFVFEVCSYKKMWNMKFCVEKCSFESCVCFQGSLSAFPCTGFCGTGLRGTPCAMAPLDPPLEFWWLEPWVSCTHGCQPANLLGFNPVVSSQVHFYTSL